MPGDVAPCAHEESASSSDEAHENTMAKKNTHTVFFLSSGNFTLTQNHDDDDAKMSMLPKRVLLFRSSWSYTNASATFRLSSQVRT